MLKGCLLQKGDKKLERHLPWLDICFNRKETGAVDRLHGSLPPPEAYLIG